MTDPRERRKLVAILSADVEGYSRLMGDDDAFTVKTLTEYRSIFQSCVTDRSGRVVNTPGDAILTEFSSAIDAVDCAVAIQDRLSTANGALPSTRQMNFRIGVSLGEVIQKGPAAKTQPHRTWRITDQPRRTQCSEKTMGFERSHSRKNRHGFRI